MRRMKQLGRRKPKRILSYRLDNGGIDQATVDEALSQFPADIPERVIKTSVPLTEMLHLLKITPAGVPTSTKPTPVDFG